MSKTISECGVCGEQATSAAMFKKKQLMLDMVDENGDFPISTASYEMFAVY